MELVTIADKAVLTYDSYIFTCVRLKGRTSALNPWAANNISYTAGVHCYKQHLHSDTVQRKAVAATYY